MTKNRSRAMFAAKDFVETLISRNTCGNFTTLLTHSRQSCREHNHFKQQYRHKHMSMASARVFLHFTRSLPNLSNVTPFWCRTTMNRSLLSLEIYDTYSENTFIIVCLRTKIPLLYWLKTGSFPNVNLVDVLLTVGIIMCTVVIFRRLRINVSYIYTKIDNNLNLNIVLFYKSISHICPRIIIKHCDHKKIMNICPFLKNQFRNGQKSVSFNFHTNE